VVEAHPITAVHIHLHMMHRVTAVILLASAIWLAVRTRRELGGAHPVARFALAWCGLVVVQASFGAFTVWSKKAADIATLHVVLGALTLLSMALAAVCASRAGAVRVLGSSSQCTVPPHPGPLAPGEGLIASAFSAVESSPRGH
jgi:heme A synthase